jgi:hypothetical protein
MQYTAVAEISSNEELFEILNKLIDGWCDRRALNALRLILPGYFAFNGLTDGWEFLHEALRDVRAFCRDELTHGEQVEIGRAIVAVQQVIDKTFEKPPHESRL